MKKHLIIAGLILATSSLSFAATTTNVAKPQPNCAAKKEEMQKPPKRPNLEELLNLTEEQKAKADEIRKQGHKQMKPVMENLKSKCEQKRLLMQNQNAGVKEAEKLEKLNKEISNLREQANKIRQQNNKQFEAILTPEQLKKFNEIKKEGRQNFNKMHKGKPFGPLHEEDLKRPDKERKCPAKPANK